MKKSHPVLLACALATPAGFAAAQQYAITALPVPAGGTAGIAYSDSVAGVGGQSFVGDWNQAEGIWQPSLWQSSQVTLLPVPQGYGGRVTALNASGEAAGDVSPGTALEPLPAAWSNGQLQLLDTLGLASGYATAVNSRGVVVGVLNASVSAVPVVWNNGAATALGLPQGVSSAEAIGINDTGQILVASVGGSNGSSWIWSGGSYTQIPAAGLTAPVATAMNNVGQVVGSSESLTSGYPFGFLYSNGATSPLAVPAGEIFTEPAAINDAGLIVGYGSDGVDGSHAMLWEDGQVYDLNTLIPANSGWTLSEALGIGQDGTIVGQGLFDGQQRAFELTPVALPSESPEPASLGVLALGVLALLRRRGRACGG